MSLEAWGDEGKVGIEGYVTDESYDEMCTEKDDEIKRLWALLDEASTNPEGDYYLGLRCGVEDRDIYDRYDAAEYGWDQAFEYIGTIATNGSNSTPEKIP